MTVTAPGGFVANGVACGIKGGGRPDLALVATDDGRAVPAAAVFTSNQAAAAPVQVSRRHLVATAGRAAAVVLNSGNANAATGAAGLHVSERTCDLVAASLGCRREEVLVCSTGLIGIPLPVDPIGAGVGDLVAGLDAEGGTRAADAILTTDTRRKEVVVRGDGWAIAGMAKGAAMLAPDMATMLAVLTTDAEVEPGPLQAALAAATAASFNRMTVDGATSTNDAVILLASGRAGPPAREPFAAALTDACASLALQMAADAEGATKLVRVRVRGAHTDAQAVAAARKVAESQLVKCSLYGRDPYWGRVVSELGSAGVEFDVDFVSIAYGGVVVCRDGVACGHDARALAAHMAGREIDLDADLGLGEGTAEIVTADLTHAYVDENMTTS
ncbi:MAG TPA: bifunctional glutamate N-acetyltransferase/amino-acid acetyltransferase ArgJ [Acidimicrobiales bacterium]|nr:bifunctional glutamate N-acetyltransferase/amino-acid acetyltransferase ArgJ [Acidimicrobiales bacterium]